MFVATVQFDSVNANDYRDLPDAAIYFTTVREVIAAFEEYASEQTSGARVAPSNGKASFVKRSAAR